ADIRVAAELDAKGLSGLRVGLDQFADSFTSGGEDVALAAKNYQKAADILDSLQKQADESGLSGFGKQLADLKKFTDDPAIIAKAESLVKRLESDKFSEKLDESAMRIAESIETPLEK